MNIVAPYTEDLAAFEEGGLYGFVNLQKDIVIPPIYTEVRSFSEGYCPVSLDELWGYIDKEGNKVCEFIYENAYEVVNGLAPVCHGGKWGFGKIGESDRGWHSDLVDNLGFRLVVACKYDNLSPSFSPEGLLFCMRGTRWGAINKDNEIVIPFIYDGLFQHSEGMAMCMLLGKCGYLDLRGRIKIGRVFDDIRPFYGGMAAVCEDKQWWFINKKGYRVVPCDLEKMLGTGVEYYENVFGTENELMGVQLEGKWGFINRKGVIVIRPQFDQVDKFLEGYCSVKIGELWYVIDEGGLIQNESDFT